MSDLSPLARAAVLGTRNHPFSPTSLPGAITDALPPRPESDTRGTGALLDTAAAYGAVHRAAVAPPPPDASPAGPELRVPASSRTPAPRALCEALERILANNAHRQLLTLALETTAENDWRLPPRLLMGVLDDSSYTNADRNAFLGVVDEHAAAVLRHHPVWGRRVEELLAPDAASAAGPEGAGGQAAAWELGTTAQRLRYFSEVRAQDPAAALALLDPVTWKREKAEARRGFVEAMAAGLGPGDTDFLEAALRDRADSVRRAALPLLLRLPGSSPVAHAEALAASHITVRKRLLRGTEVTCTLVELNEEGVADLIAHDLYRTPRNPFELLKEVIERVPVDRWPDVIGLTAREFLEAKVTYEHHSLKLHEVLFAASRRADGALVEDWAADLFEAGKVIAFRRTSPYWSTPYSAAHSRRVIRVIETGLSSPQRSEAFRWAADRIVTLPVDCAPEALPEALEIIDKASEHVERIPGDYRVRSPAVAAQNLRLRIELEALRPRPDDARRPVPPAH